MIVKELTISRLLNEVQQCTPQWGVQAIERSCDSKMEGLRPDNFAFAKLPTQTCVCKMIPRFAPAKRGFLLPEAHEIAVSMAQIAQSAVFAH